MMVKNGSRIQKYAKYFFILSETNLSCATVIRKYCLECAHNLQISHILNDDREIKFFLRKMLFSQDVFIEIYSLDLANDVST